MNCARCPHMRAIQKALRPCQTCDAGRLHGQLHIDSASVDWAYAQRAASDHTPSSGVTSLPPDVEDAVRKLMATIVQLEPHELLLLQSVLKNKSYAAFRHTLADLERKLRTKEAELMSKDSQGFRQLAQIWAENIKAKLPMFAPVLEARIDGE